ncbi:MAG TPA: glycosyltransferase family 39 protein [Patescibacteria group bacterium]
MKRFFTKYNLIFALIIFIAIFFRLYLLSSVPPSASLDEATIGWNAYSIMLTGHDEYGYHLPILLRAYDDYRPALYVYLVIPFIKLLGLNVLSVRLPSAILSLITVVTSFFLSKVLLRKYKYEKWISLCVMGLFAISPFHIYISRLGHEANPGLTFAVVGITLFLWGIFSKRNWLVIFSFIFWAASFYTYQSEKIFVPLIIITLLLSFYKDVLKNKKVIILGFIIATMLSLPILFATLQPGSLLRAKGTSVFSDMHPYIVTSLKLEKAVKDHDIFGEIIYNRRFVPISIFVSNYLPHFNPIWWVSNYGLEDFKAPGFGLSYPWELPFFLIGFIFLWRLKIAKSLKLLPIIWIFIAFLPAGISTQTPHAMRSFNILPVPQLIEAIGLFEIMILIGKIKNFGKILQYIFISTFSIFVVFGIISFYRAYFIDFPRLESSQYQLALHLAISYALSQNDYKYIAISNQNQATQSYMFYLFDTKYDPIKYFKNGGTKSGGFSVSHHIDHVDFIPFASDMKVKKETLYIGNRYLGTINALPDNISILKKFMGLYDTIELVAFVPHFPR